MNNWVGLAQSMQFYVSPESSASKIKTTQPYKQHSPQFTSLKITQQQNKESLQVHVETDQKSTLTPLP